MTRAKGSEMDKTSTAANSVSGGASVGGGVTSISRPPMNCTGGVMSSKEKTPANPNNSAVMSAPGATSNYSSASGGGGSTATKNNSSTTGSQPAFPAPAEHLPKLKSILPVATQCVHTPCYCEENVWKLCDSIRKEHPSELDYCHVAFISNPKRMVPMWRQKSGKNEEKLALWDYHVILLYNPDERCVVYDMDSDLPFPTHFHRYVSETFRTENILQPEYHRFFRVVPASRFLSLFSSDRKHMLRSDGTWIKQPPSYPPIFNGVSSNLDNFMDMTTPKNEFGEMFSLMELVRRFYKPRQLS